MANEKRKHRMHVFKYTGTDIDEIRSRNNEVTARLRKIRREEILQKRRNIPFSYLTDEDDIDRTLASTNVHDFVTEAANVEHPEAQLPTIQQNVPVSYSTDVDEIDRTMTSTNLHDFVMEAANVENPEAQLPAIQQNVPVRYSTDVDDIDRTMTSTNLHDFVMEAANVENPEAQVPTIQQNVPVSYSTDVDDIDRTLASTNLNEFGMEAANVENPEVQLAAVQRNVPVSYSRDEDDIDRTTPSTNLRGFVTGAANVVNPVAQLAPVQSCRKASPDINSLVNELISNIMGLVVTCQKPRDFPGSSLSYKDDVRRRLASANLYRLVMAAGNVGNPKAQLAAVQQCTKLSAHGQTNNAIIIDMVEFGIIPTLIKCMTRKDSWEIQCEATMCIINILYHCRGGL